MPTKTKTILEVVSILAICSLVSGFLIVNIYLAQFGFWNYTFLQVEYIAAGVLFILFVAFGIFLVFLGKEINLSFGGYFNKFNKKHKYVFIFFQRLITYLLLLTFNFLFFLIFIEVRNTFQNIVVILLSVIWEVIIFSLIKTTLNFRKKISQLDTPDQAKSIASRWFNLSTIFIAPILILFLIMLSSILIYPSTPRFLGGGKPVRVMLYFENNTEFASPLMTKLIYQNSDFLLLDIQNETYWVKQSQVKTIKYLDRTPGAEKISDLFN